MLTYYPEQKLIKDGKNQEEFYCGDCFNEVAIIMARLYLGTLSLQDAYNQVHNYINGELFLGIKSQVKEAVEEALEEAIKEGKVKI